MAPCVRARVCVWVLVGPCGYEDSQDIGFMGVEGYCCAVSLGQIAAAACFLCPRPSISFGASSLRWLFHDNQHGSDCPVC